MSNLPAKFEEKEIRLHDLIPGGLERFSSRKKDISAEHFWQNEVNWSRDRQHLIHCGPLDYLKYIDGLNGKTVWEFNQQGVKFTLLLIHPHQNLGLVSLAPMSQDDRDCELWFVNLDNHQVIWKYFSSEWVSEAAFDRQNKLLAITDFGADLAVLDVKTGKVIWKRNTDEIVWTISWSDESKHIAVGGQGNILQIYQASDGE